MAVRRSARLVFSYGAKTPFWRGEGYMLDSDPDDSLMTHFWTPLTVATSCMSEMSAGPFPLAPPRSCLATFHTAFATWRPRPAV